MSDNKEHKERFFIAGDIVKHIKTGVIYTVEIQISGYETDIDIFYEGDSLKCFHEETGTHVYIPFDELELVESAGVYMGAGLNPPTYQDGYMQGLENWIKAGYVSSAPSDPNDLWLSNDVTETKYNNLKPHYHHTRINTNTWALFGALGIDTIQFVDNIAWVVHYQKSKSQSLEPRFARAFLDRLDLTEGYESRIGNQDEWERVFNQEYPSDLDKLIDFSSPTPNYPDEPAE